MFLVMVGMLGLIGVFSFAMNVLSADGSILAAGEKGGSGLRAWSRSTWGRSVHAAPAEEFRRVIGDNSVKYPLWEHSPAGKKACKENLEDPKKNNPNSRVLPEKVQTGCTIYEIMTNLKRPQKQTCGDSKKPFPSENIKYQNNSYLFMENKFYTNYPHCKPLTTKLDKPFS